ncbi:aspartate kinase [Mesotoga sp.]|uniref:aspartate kinase n=1 Tax=Mesotoga sp. TaxID=2053577 RepID=UPI0016B9EF18|nr:aspartate kinase [Thermotogaceae bacterium]
MRIGIAGLGTVGSCVYAILKDKGDEIEKRSGRKCIVSKVITRTHSKYEKLGIPSDLVAEDFEDLIINSDIVVETIGGTEAARTLIKQSLDLNRTVVTANKMLISEFGNEFTGSSPIKNLFFEAAVGGGIPIISLLEDYLIFHGIKRVRGILNGTTNFILSEMLRGMDYAEALEIAQKKGYAEADPSSDVKGYDAAYKLSVLMGVKTGVFPGISNIETMGIEEINKSDLERAASLDRKVKLIGTIDFEKGNAFVKPQEIERNDPLWSVDGVENAIEVETDLSGRFILRGEGAGAQPTATAIISDILRASRYAEKQSNSVVIMKFGGTSVDSAEKIKDVAERVQKKVLSGVKPVIVVSAMGVETDKLHELAKEISSKPNGREMDMLLATGEQKSIALVAMAIQVLGMKSISLSGNQARIQTDSNFSNARIVGIDADLINRYLSNGYVPVVAGFQGSTYTGEITTLGRGGSDLTAVVLAKALGSQLCEIYKDVDGVYSADPRIVQKARPIKEISWEEMIELSKQGAQVLQSRASEFARKYDIKVLVKNAHSNARGTLIWRGSKVEQPIVRAVTSDDEIVKVVLQEVPDRPGIAARVLKTLAEQNVNIDMIIQSMRSGEFNTMAFTIHGSDLSKLKQDILKTRSEAKEITVESSIAKLSIVGVNLTATPAIAATLFETLANEGINIDMISASNSRISVVIDSNMVHLAVNAIHSAFSLEEIV